MEKLTTKQALQYLEIPEKDFKNYTESSMEIKREKIGSRWFYNKDELIE